MRFIKNDPDLFCTGAIHYPTLVPNTFQGVGVAGISSLGVFNESRYTELVSTYFNTRSQSGFVAPTALLPSRRPILDLLNVKYVVTHSATPQPEGDLHAAGLVPAMSDDRFTVFRNPTVWPRAFVAHNYRVVPDRASAIRAAASGTADIAILEASPEFPPGGGPATPCHIVRYTPNEVRVAGNEASAGMLVLLDSFGRGWSARVNGQPSPIVPAYGAFRGVEVPAGRWEVTMEYEPPRIRAGAVVSALSVMLSVVALWSNRRLPGTRVADARKDTPNHS